MGIHDLNESKDIELALLGSSQKLRLSPAKSTTPQSHKTSAFLSRIGIGYQLLSCFFSVAMNAIRKQLLHIPASQILFARTPIILVIVFLYFIANKQMNEFWAGFNKNNFRTGALITAFSTFLFIAVPYLPLSESSTIFSTSGIFNGIFAAIILGERYPPIQQFLGVTSFVGVILVARPPILFGSQGEEAVGTDSQQGLSRTTAALCALLAAVLNAGAQISIRASKMTSHGLTVPFQANFVMFVFYALYYLFIETLQPFSTKDYFWIVIFALCTLGAIYFNALALQHEPPSIVGIISYSLLVFSLLFDIILFRELPSLLTLAGGSLIVGSCLYVFRKN